MYAIFDKKAACYATPFFAPRDAVAHRLFGDLINDDRSTVNKHPDDYSLDCIGEFDDGDGKVQSSKPQSIVNGASVYLIKTEPLATAAGGLPPAPALTNSGAKEIK